MDRFKGAWSDPSRRPSLVFGLAAVALALILVVVALGQVSGTSQTIQPTPVDTGCVVNCGPNSQAASNLPKVLHVRGRSILLNPVSMSDGQWKASVEAGRAEWVYGTFINYLIGVPFSQE
ncbi:MAG TPA: hypothetical protein VFK30_14555, partial [Anaerolineae bacterium]|nr:hypothetical protein [Anaerolineae bacterium]